jgi:hypothetical protein
MFRNDIGYSYCFKIQTSFFNSKDNSSALKDYKPRCRAIVSRGFQQSILLRHYHIVQQSFSDSVVYCTAVNVIF